MSEIKCFLIKLALPVSSNEDVARREFILNIFLVLVTGLSITAFVVNLSRIVFGLTNEVYASILFAVLSFVVFSLSAFLYFLSRKGFFILASFIFLGTLFLLNSFTIISYGIDVPEAVLTYALIIIMSSILISTRFAFFGALVIVITILSLGYLQITSILQPQSQWKMDELSIGSIVFISVTFLVIATVSWLSNREIEKSLRRARESEAELKKEKDSLEIKVEERTKELKETQAEKMTQLYRFAEFGRLSSGLFHDLINPLNAVSLNVEKLKSSPEETSGYVDRAVRAAKKLENLVTAIRKQLVRPAYADTSEDKQENKTIFYLNEEIRQVIEVLSYKAQKALVKIKFSENAVVKTFGEAVKFNQIILNLVANAIEACEDLSDESRREINISLSRADNHVALKVKDGGVGIAKENKQKIFEPFFTTKSERGGVGIGLSMVKRFVEKNFGSSIDVESEEEKGSVFIVKFPIKTHERRD